LKTEQIDLKGSTVSDTEKFIIALNEKSFRAGQVRKWIFEKGVDSFDEMTDLSKILRTQLPDLSFITDLTKIKKAESTDGTGKYLFKTADGLFIESVYIPEGKRATLCVSSQVGCKFACSFCATGKSFVRNLTAGEIVDQAIKVKREEGRLTNIVFMGMGEPLDNFENVLKAIDIISEPSANLVGLRKITLSTAGVVPMIKRLTEIKPSVKLAVSITSAIDKTRDSLMPINRKYNIESILSALEKWPMQEGRKFTFEYIMLGGINDSDADAFALARITKRVPCKVNLIPYNSIDSTPYEPSGTNRINAFRRILEKKDVSVTIRKSRGGDILAACGQLANVQQ
jgi:23S rRNA (adenine2503-C2)-methyltransferase